MKYVFIFGLVLYLVKLNKCFPLNSTVISKYAKVAVWGTNKTDSSTRNEGRTSKSGNIWNHRLDSKGSSTSKKKDISIAYQYPVYQRPASKIDKHTEHIPGIGEVIVAQAQDRFEARPLFAYKNQRASASATYGPPPVPTSAPAADAATPAAAPPPLAPAAPGGDYYNSPYSSYNPPSFKPDDNNADLYPPNIPSNGDSNSAPPQESQMSASTEAGRANNGDSYASLGPPLAPYGDVDQDPGQSDDDNPGYAPQNVQDQDPMAIYKYQDGPPQHPPKSLDDVYYPPNFPKDQIADHGNHGMRGNGGGAMMKAPQNPPKSLDDVYYPPDFPKDQIADHGNHGMQGNGGGNMMKAPQNPPKSLDDVYYPPDFPKDQIADHGMQGNGGGDMMKAPQGPVMMPPDDHGAMDSGPSNGDDAAAQDDPGDVAPPPPHGYGNGHAFPQYLYDHHHYNHHVYEEIPHTTMAPAKEDKRVSTTNYSYYYLGRKLWYIPLYFSIYFIIYVTVLILKSIARHKVRLKYKWYEHDSKHARSMDFDAVRDEELTDLHQNVSISLKNATAKYGHVMAM